MFYFDDILKKHELEYSWDKALLYLDRVFKKHPTNEKLNSLVGFAWYYLIEGPIDSGRFEKDENNLSLDIWEKYLSIGLKNYLNVPSFCFIAGYTLLMHGFYIEEYKGTYEELGLDMLNSVCNSTEHNLKEIANVIIEYQKQKKYKPLKVKSEVVMQLFQGESLIEKYFKNYF